MAKELTEQGYRELKASVEAARSEADKAQGAVDTLLKRLKDEFDCRDVKAATALLKQLNKEHKDASDEFNQLLAAYEKKWSSDAD